MPWKRYLDTDTRSNTHQQIAEHASTVTALTLLSHCDPARVGEMAWLDALERQGTQPVSRLEPGFVRRMGGEERPLADPRISRRPFRLGRRDGAYFVDTTGSGLSLEVDGEPVSGRRDVTDQELKRGVVLLVGERAAFCWHRARLTANPPPRFGLVGESRTMLRLRRDIAQVADVDVPVLIRGESGSGKELVARAIQNHSKRRSQEFQTINLGAVPPSLAAAELFGAARGAYSGADRARRGYFQQCEGGTLFLDEIGEASHEVQAMLLRALESGEIQPVGSPKTLKVDVRVLAATDADLESAVDGDSFKAPLLHRLQAFQLTIAPLRERRDDIGRLFFHFLREGLASCGEAHRLDDGSLFGPAFVPARIVASLALHTWPGNARELRNVATQAAIRSRGARVLRAEGWVGEPPPAEIATAPAEAHDESLGDRDHLSGAETSDPSTDSAPPDHPKQYRDPGSVAEEELRAVLRGHDWNLRQAAETLGVSRGSLYDLIERTVSIRTAAELDRDEIVRELRNVDGDLVELARHFEVSTLALKRRLKQLGLR